MAPSRYLGNVYDSFNFMNEDTYIEQQLAEHRNLKQPQPEHKVLGEEIMVTTNESYERCLLSITIHSPPRGGSLLYYLDCRIVRVFTSILQEIFFKINFKS